MKFKKFKKIVKLVEAYYSTYESHHNISEAIDSLIKEEEKNGDFPYGEDLMKFHDASENAINFLLDVIFGEEDAELVNSFVYRKVYGNDAPSPYDVETFDSLKDLYNHIECNKSLFPVLYEGKEYYEDDCDIMFLSFYHDRVSLTPSGGVYMAEGDFVYPDGSIG
jgi:hypothetical protein